MLQDKELYQDKNMKVLKQKMVVKFICGAWIWKVIESSVVLSHTAVLLVARVEGVDAGQC